MVDKRTLDGCLKDVGFPADGPEIADCAAGNSCPDEALVELRRLQARTYRTEEGILCELGDPSYCS
jgi:hypothetical protein